MAGIRPAGLRHRIAPLALLLVATLADGLFVRFGTHDEGAAAVLPMLAAATVVAAALRLGRNRIRLWRIRHRGGHLVIAGDETLVPIVAGEAASATPAIVLVRDRPPRWLRRLGHAGSPHLRDDAGDMGGYLRKARMVLLAGAGDDGNLALARTILRAASSVPTRDLPLPMVVRIDDASRHAAVEAALARERVGDHVHVRLVSLPALIARSLLRANVVDRVERVGTRERLLAILGYTAVTERYLLDAMAGGRFADGRDLRVVVVDPHAGAREAFLAHRPSVEGIEPPTFLTARLADPAMLATLSGAPPAAVVIDAGDPSASLAALEAVDATMRAAGQAAPAYAVHAPAAALGASVIPATAFGGGDVADYRELLLYERQEATARAVHEFFLEDRLDEGATLGSRPEVNGWDALGEAIRDDRRLLVDLHALKLRDIGARVVPGRGPSLALEPDELDALASTEHARPTAAWRRSAGDGPIPAPGGEAEQVRIVNRLLARSGRHAVRDLRVLVEPGFTGDALAAADGLARAYPDRQLVFLGEIADPSVRAVLHALDATGHLVQIALACHLDALAADLSPDEARRCRTLVRRADRIVVPPAGDPPGPLLAARAHRRLAAPVGRQRPAHPRIVAA